MATKLFFRNAASDFHTGTNDTRLSGSATNWTPRLLSTTAGSSTVQSAASSTLNGPTNGVEVSISGGLTGVWYSLPLNADITISGSVTWNIWGRESDMSANVAINGRLEVIDGATGTITLIDQTARVTELAVSATTNAVNNFAETPAAGVACKRGDRLRVRIVGDDVGTMAVGFTFQVGYDGPTASVDGDTWLQLTENLTFVSEPAGTTIYPTDTASAVSTASVDREAWTSRGAGVQTDVTNTAASVAAPVQVTDTAGGTVVDWFTKQLTAFTLGGAVRVNVRGLESNTLNQQTFRCEIARVASDGTSPTVWGATTHSAELGLTETALSFLVGGDDLAISDGQRLRIRFYTDEYSEANPTLTGTVTLYYAGTSGGASGDTYLTFTQTLTEFSAGTSANAITATATGSAPGGADAIVATPVTSMATGTANNPSAVGGIATITDAATATGAAHNATAGAINATVAGTPFSDTSNVASYATASWTPVAGRLYLVAVANSDAANAITPTLSGNGQTWDQVATRQLTDLSRRVTVFRCVAASPTTGALTADFAGDAQTGCNIHIAEFTGFDPSGTNGSGAIVQSVGAEWATGGADPLITLAAFSNANNATYGAIESNAAFVSVGSGFTQLASTTVATPTVNLLTEWRNSNDTSVDADSGSGAGVGIGIEVKAAAVAATSATAQVATATGAAYDADLLPSQVFSAQVATGTGAAGDTDATAGATTGSAAATGAASNATTKVTANLGVATGTGAALDADLFPSQVFTAGLATATGTALDATVSTATAATSANAITATATAAAGDTDATIAAATATATGTGAALDTTAKVRAQSRTPYLIDGTGTAYDTDAKLAAPTGTAAATGAASNATAKVAVNLSTATATGAAHDADLLPAQLFSAGTATGTGAALDADALPGTRALAGAATATGAAADADGAPSDVGPAELATAAGTAQNLTAKIAPVLQAASATGAALNANVTTTAAGQASTQLAEGTGLAQGTDAVVAATTLAAGAAGTAHNATVTHTAAASATAGVATATGAAHNATGLVSGQAVSVTAGVATGTGTAWPVAQRRRRRPRPTQGYPPSLASRRFVDHVKAYAELAQGFGRAYDAHIEWDDDEAALILLLMDAA